MPNLLTESEQSHEFVQCGIYTCWNASSTSPLAMPCRAAVAAAVSAVPPLAVSAVAAVSVAVAVGLCDSASSAAAAASIASSLGLTFLQSTCNHSTKYVHHDHSVISQIRSHTLRYSTICSIYKSSK
jgi:hypothetical protein